MRPSSTTCEAGGACHARRGALLPRARRAHGHACAQGAPRLRAFLVLHGQARRAFPARQYFASKWAIRPSPFSPWPAYVNLFMADITIRLSLSSSTPTFSFQARHPTTRRESCASAAALTCTASPSAAAANCAYSRSPSAMRRLRRRCQLVPRALVCRFFRLRARAAARPHAAYSACATAQAALQRHLRRLCLLTR